MCATTCLMNAFRVQRYLGKRWISLTHTNSSSDAIIDPPDHNPPLPEYQERKGENIKELKARLIYQSRKRGMLENGLLLSTFAAKFLPVMSENQLRLYDKLINKPSNDWDIYYWATGVKDTPQEFQHEVMEMLKQHVKNDDRSSRIRQPDLY